ncbi:MAG: hypothetical protein AMJ81_04600 [Phycisphaerae bacterium SM23_33]|nr:MAG: hypothetical protein AMJ81_04600 [Phycisphaerae bacterium SM23_33]
MLSRDPLNPPRSWEDVLVGRSGAWPDYDKLVSELAAIGPAGLGPMVEALGHDSSDVRAAAAEALGRIGDGRAVPALSRALKDRHEWVRYKVTRALGRIGGPQAVDALVKALEDEIEAETSLLLTAVGSFPGGGEDVYLCEIAAEELGRIRDPRAVGPLIEALTHPKGLAAHAAAEALGGMDDKRAAEALVAAAECDNPYAQQAAWECLFGSAGTPDPGGTMLEKLGEGKLFAVVGLGEWPPDCDTARAVEALVPLLSERDLAWRAAAAESLGKLKDPAAVAPLAEMLAGEEDPAVKCAAVWALGRIGTPAALEAVPRAAHDADSAVCKAAALALAKTTRPSGAQEDP